VNERILGSLKGLATGDAIGKQTETLSRADVVPWYPAGVRGFEGPPGSVIPRYVGNRKREWRIGETTDDTEQTIAVARAILEDGCVRHTTVGRQLLRCTKSLHPGVRSLWEFHQAGDPARIASTHDGCGAAMRVSPVGMRYSSTLLDAIVAGAREASIPTHGGPLALAAAAATAAAVSAAIDAADAYAIVDLAARAAAQAERERTSSTDAPFAQQLRTLYTDLSGWHELEPGALAARYFPDRSLTIVPLAIVLAAVMTSAADAILLAANIGGDSDSVASIAGAILGARCPATVNDDWHAVVEDVNRHELAALAAELSRVRR
jgi:ADP-ribosylglycohydrolase